MTRKLLFTIIFVSFASNFFAQNLLTNGDFESGGNGVGFSLNGSGYNFLASPTGNTNAGDYAFGTNPNPYNTASFIATGDHTTGTGRMMLIDGNPTDGNQRFWRAGNSGGGVCGLTVGVTYTFSYWIRSIFTTVSGSPTLANIGIQFNNVSSFTLTSGSATAPATASGWQQVRYTFVPNNSCVQIELWNTNTDYVGNDFAVDDFSVTAPAQPLTLSTSFSNETCPSANDGTVTAYGKNGTTPYIYNLTGASTQTNTTGLFTGLTPGTYNVSVTDSGSPPSTVSATNIVVSSATPMTISSTGSCINELNLFFALGVSSGNTFTWTSTPFDANVAASTANNIFYSFPVATTITASTTETSTTNLVYNGDFSAGNNGFYSDYNFLTTTTPSGAQKTYGIATNSQSWFAGFSSCFDHTSPGTGRMFVCDGSTSNSGNDKVWQQTIAVQPNKTYTFSYWVQSVATPNFASLEVFINGSSVGINTAPSTTCSWQLRTYTWNSGTNTSATIIIYDRTTTSSGNDFAIDDISFSTINSCFKTATFVVGGTKPTITCGTATSSSVNFVWTALTGATGYQVSHSINSGAIINDGNITATTFSVNSLSPSDTVTITVTPTGTGCFSGTSFTCSALVGCPQPTVSAVTQPTCTTSTGSFTITNYDPTYTYAFSPTVITNIAGTVTANAGTYTITASKGTCTSVSSANVVVNPQPTTPAQPSTSIVTQPTCATATGTFTITNYNPAYTYTFNPSVVTNIAGTVTANAGTYTVTATLGSCTSVSSANIVVNLQPITPAQPTVSTISQPTCITSIGSFTISNYNPTFVYTFSPTVITNIAGVVTANSGTYTITATLGSCTSVSSANVVVNPQPTTPVQPIVSTVIQPTCATATGSFTITNYNPAYTYTFNPSVVTNIAGTVTANAGTYTVTATLGSCTSVSSANIVVNLQPITPAQPTVSTISQPTCITSIGSFTISNYNPTFVYTFSPTVITNIAGTVTANAGTYTITASNGTCTSVSSANVVVNPQPTTPVQPTVSAVTQPTCATATGSFTITNYNPAYTYTFNPSVVTNIAGTVTANAGTYTVTATLGSCTSVSSANIVVNPQPITPAQPTVSTISQPTCTTSIGSFTISNYNPTYIYTFSPTVITNIAGTVTANAGTYTIIASNGTCTSVSSANVVVNPQPTTPIQPIVSTVTQPTCATATGSFTISNYNNLYTYSFSPSIVTRIGNLVTANAGTYTITASNGTCTSVSSASIIVNAQPTIPSKPTLSAIQPSCTTSTGTITITNYNASLVYTISPSIGSISPTFVVNPGTYTITVTQGLCSSSASITINSQPSTPIAPITNPVSYCQFVSALPLTATGTNLLWYTTATGGTGSTTAPTPPTSATGVFNYYVSQTTNGCESPRALLQVTINTSITPIFTAIAPICEGTILAPLPTTSTNGITGSWSPSLSNTQTLTYTFIPDNGQCAVNQTLKIVVYPNPNPVLKDGTICFNKETGALINGYTLYTYLNNPNYTYQWFKDNVVIANSNSNEYTATTAGSYYAVITDSATGCVFKSNIATVIDKQVSFIFDYVISEYFNENPTITINSSNVNNGLLYQLDYGNPQSSNIFENVGYGKHTIRIFDPLGCIDIIEERCVVGYPKFFTPNGDSYNDTWNIYGYDCMDKPTVYIFDRYGKLITNIDNNKGWDGTFNGNNLFADDYWFKIIYTENGVAKELKSHFSLKR